MVTHSAGPQGEQGLCVQGFGTSVVPPESCASLATFGVSGGFGEAAVPQRGCSVPGQTCPRVGGCSPWWLSPGEQVTGTCDSMCCWLGGSGVAPSAPEEEMCVPRSTRALSPLHPTGGTRWLLLPPGALPPLQIPVFFPAVRPRVLLSRRLSPAGGRAQLGGQTPSPLPASSPRGLAFQSGLRRKQRSRRHALPTHTHTHVSVWLVPS